MTIQKYSTFHDSPGKHLTDWHKPYAGVLTPYSPILDLGCGPGYFADAVKALGGKVAGIDIDPAMVAMSNANSHPAELGDHRSLDRFTEHWGAIHVSHVVEHLWGDDVELLIRLAAKALKPGGVLVIRTPNWKTAYVRHYLFWMDHTHKRPYPHELLRRMVDDLGLHTVHAGQEPLGMADTYFIAQKPDAVAIPPMAPAWDVPPETWSQRFRRLRHRWLPLPGRSQDEAY